MLILQKLKSVHYIDCFSEQEQSRKDCRYNVSPRRVQALQVIQLDVTDAYEFSSFEYVVEFCNDPEEAVRLPIFIYDHVNLKPEEVRHTFRNIKNILTRIIKNEVNNRDRELIEIEITAKLNGKERVYLDNDGSRYVEVNLPYDGSDNSNLHNVLPKVLQIEPHYVWLAYKQMLYQKLWVLYFFRSNSDKDIMLEGNKLLLCHCEGCEDLVFAKVQGGKKFCGSACQSRQNRRDHRRRQREIKASKAS